MNNRVLHLFDTKGLQKLLDAYTRSANMATAILDTEGNILAASGWQDICTKFFRQSPDACKNCLASDTALANDLKAGKPYNVYRCLNGLVDVATPIILDGTHVANLFIGQFLFNRPDRAFFEKQAQQYGFDHNAFMAAVEKIPILTEQEVEAKMTFLSELATMIGRMGIQKRELKSMTESLEQRVSERTSALKDAQIATLNMMQDAEEARIRAQDTTRQLELALRAGQTGIFDFNIKTGGVDVSPEFERMLGYEPGELTMSYDIWYNSVHPDDREAAAEAVQQYLNGETEEYVAQFRFKMKNGRYKWVLARGEVGERDKDGEPIRLIGTHTDISKQQEMMEKLEQSNKELEQFAYVASHDLQEPLRMVSSYTQLLEKRYKDQLDDDARDFIRFAVDGANRMQRLIQDLLTYSRITTRGKEPEPISSHSILGHALANLSETIRETGAIVTNDNLPFVMGDQSQLVMLFQNLISNGIKFNGEESPRVHISVRGQGDMAEFGVRDNGIGMNSEYLDRIFVIFKRLHTRSEYPGTGIGLAVCKRIVERLGGRIWVESEPGEGSTFYFTLPLAHEQGGSYE